MWFVLSLFVLSLDGSAFSADKIVVAAPPECEGRYFLQIYSQLPSRLRIWGNSAVVDSAGEKRDSIEIVNGFESVPLMWLEDPGQARVRLILTNTDRFADYSFTSFLVESSTIRLLGLKIVPPGLSKIQRTPPFTLKWVEHMDAKEGIVPPNILSVPGLPRAFYRPIAHSMPGTWLYRADCLFHAGSGEYYPLLAYFGTWEEPGRARGSLRVSAEEINTPDHVVLRESYRGD